MSDEATTTTTTVSDSPAVEQEVSQAAGAVETATKDATPPAAEAPKEDPAVALKARQVAEFTKQQRAFRKQQEESKARESALAQREAELNQVYQQLLDKHKQIEAWQQELDQDPVTWLQKYKKIGPEEYYQRALNKGQPSKDEVLSRQLEQAMARIEELSSWRTQREQAEQEALSRREAEAKAAEEKKFAAEQEAQLESARGEFWKNVETNPRTYPYLSTYPRDVVIQAATEYVVQQGEKANSMSYAEVAAALETGLREWSLAQHSKVKPLLEPETPVAPNSTPSGANDTPQAAAPAIEKAAAAAKVAKSRRAVGKASTNLTLNSDLSSSRGNAKVRTPEEEIEALKRELEAQYPQQDSF